MNKRTKPRIGTMNLILVLVGVTLLAYTVTVLIMTAHYITVPSELTVAVFGVCGGECGIMGWIKTTKDRQQEHRWQAEERRREEQSGPEA